MRATGAAISRYVPGHVPDDPADLTRFLQEELIRLQQALNLMMEGQLDVTSVAPAKPRNGMLRYSAAGILGVGEGFYGREAGAWVKL